MSEVQLNCISEEIAGKQPGFPKRLLWLFTSPGKLMECLAEKPRILFALIFMLISTDALLLARLPLYKDMVREQTLAASGYMESLTGRTITPEMVEQNLPTTIITNLFTIPIMAVIMWLIMTTVYFAVLKIMGGQGKFKAYLSVTGYASVISGIYILLVLVVSGFTGSLHMDPTLTSLATLFTQDSVGVVLYNVLKNIDIFSIWEFAVIAIGLVAVSKLKKKYVYSTVAAVFIIGLIINVVNGIMTNAILQ